MLVINFWALLKMSPLETAYIWAPIEGTWLHRAKNGGSGLSRGQSASGPVSLYDYLLPTENIAEKIFMLFYIGGYYNSNEGPMGSHTPPQVGGGPSCLAPFLLLLESEKGVDRSVHERASKRAD